VFESVDVIVTPTSPITTPTISAFDAAFKDPSYPGSATDIRGLTLRNTSPFDISLTEPVMASSPWARDNEYTK